MKIKRIFSLTLILVFLLSSIITGYSADQDKTYEIKLTSCDSINTIWMAKMKEACEKISVRTNGKVDVQMYPSGEMLVYDEGIEAVMSDTAVIYFTDPSLFGDYVPAYITLGAPYLYSSYETVEKLMESDTIKAMNENAAKAGLHAITTSFVVGMRNVLANIPIHSVEDLKGLKIRVPGVTLYTETFDALGTNWTPMPFSEVFSAMQTGVLNAVEVTPGNAYNYKIYDALDTAYYSLTKHMLNVVGLFTGEGFWQSLPEEYSSIIEEELRAAAYESNREVDSTDAVLIQKMVDDGVILVPIDDLSAFKAKVDPMNKKFLMYDEIVAQIASFK